MPGHYGKKKGKGKGKGINMQTGKYCK